MELCSKSADKWSWSYYCNRYAVDDRVTSNLKEYATKASIIHIEIDEAEINKNVQVDVEINNDAREVLRYLLPLVKENSFEKWIREFRICDKTEYDKV